MGVTLAAFSALRGTSIPFPEAYPHKRIDTIVVNVVSISIIVLVEMLNNVLWSAFGMALREPLTIFALFGTQHFKGVRSLLGE